MTTSPGSIHGSGRDLCANEVTMISPLAPLAWSERLLQTGFELLAERLFPKISPRENGVFVAAVSPNSGELAGGLIPRPGPGRVWSGLVGRHSATSLALGNDAALSLRHAILIARITDDGCPIFRALDLRSGTGMLDANGAPHLSVIANGPLRLRLGNSALFAIPTDDLNRDGRFATYRDIDWPAPAKWLPDTPPERHIREVSRVTTRSAMVSCVRPDAPHSVRRGTGGANAGRFVVDLGGITSAIAVDEVALRTGVLFGRYPRCDINCSNAPMSELVSRVHALFLTVDDNVRVFDTGSTNGIGHGGRSADGLELLWGHDTQLSLGSGASITWCPGAGLA